MKSYFEKLDHWLNLFLAAFELSVAQIDQAMLMVASVVFIFLFMKNLVLLSRSTGGNLTKYNVST